MATKSKTTTRDHRWNFRVAEADDAVVRAASELSETSFTSFVRFAAITEAKRVLADRTRFEPSPSDWERLSEMLERPAQSPAGLRDLFSKPDVFE